MKAPEQAITAQAIVIARQSVIEEDGVTLRKPNGLKRSTNAVSPRMTGISLPSLCGRPPSDLSSITPAIMNANSGRNITTAKSCFISSHLNYGVPRPDGIPQVLPPLPSL